MPRITAKSLAERAEKARAFQHTASNGWVFTLRRPSDLQLEESIALNQRFGSTVAFKRDQVVNAVQGWEGPKVKDVDPTTDGSEAGEETLPFDRSLIGLLLEDRTDILTELADKLVEQYNARREAREKAAKN